MAMAGLDDRQKRADVGSFVSRAVLSPFSISIAVYVAGSVYKEETR